MIFYTFYRTTTNCTNNIIIVLQLVPQLCFFSKIDVSNRNYKKNTTGAMIYYVC